MIRLAPRHGPPPLGGALALLLALALALALGSLAFLAVGADPFQAFGLMAQGALGSPYGLGEVLVKTAPLTLTGLAVALAASLRLWNIGAEGQFALGAVGAAFVGLHAQSWPQPLAVPLALFAAALAGALWAGLAGWLKNAFNVNEILSTLLLTYVAILFMEHLYFGPWRDPAGMGFPGTAPVADTARLPALSGSRAHLGLALAVALASVLWLLLGRTRFGFRARVLGQSLAAARYAGFHAGRTTLLAFLLSGGLAGLAGAAELLGVQHRLQDGLASGYGFDGIIVAFLARGRVLAVPLAAFFLAAVMVGSDQLQTVLRLPGAVVRILEAALLLGLLVGEVFGRYRFVMGRAGRDDHAE